MLVEKSKKSSRKVVIISLLVVLGMFGFGYAMVPVYNLVCTKFGIGGKTGGMYGTSNAIDYSRTITVQFLANNNANLPWKFYPLTTTVKVHPGQNMQMAYFAENNSDKTMTVQAIPSVSPGLAATHLKKTECFCFNQQTLNSKQKMDMPLIFHLDTTLPKEIKTVTLSYTLFDATNVKRKIPTNPGKINR